MAEALVGGALLSSFVNVLFDRLASQEVLNLFKGKKDIAKIIEDLKIRLRSANKLLNDAEAKQLTDEDVKNWLDDLKGVLYEADHIMDKINTEALRHRVEDEKPRNKASRFFNFMPKLCSAFDNTIKFEIEEILGTLDLLLRQKDELGLNEGVLQNKSQRLPASLVDACDVHGRDDEKEAIVQLLLSDHNGGHKLSVIPIVGMGGIGKTTLAHLVYNDSRVQDHFTLKVWVTISEEFDVSKIARIIVETITSKKCNIEDPYQLQNELKKELMGKRFLFVHDDVWNESYQLWDVLKSPFDFGADGSKILVTTRSELVALNMGTVPAYNLQVISDDDCWKLFANHAFGNIGSGVRPDLQEIGKEIVKKCKGLPLAVKSVAGVLRSLSSLEEWKGILKSDVWELQFQENQKNNILPALWLSYQYLSPQLKQCFAYCSLFPKDYEFCEVDQEILVKLWMAEGLLQHERGKRIEDVGRACLNSLISRSFFQRSRRHWNGRPCLLMHDLVHDLAMRISGEFCFTLASCQQLDGLTSKTRHLSYPKGNKDMMKLEGLSKTKCLRTLLALPLSYGYQRESTLTDGILLELLSGAGGCLKALSLSQSSIMQLPNSIGDLKHLRYLDISESKIKEIPSSVCNLYNLQTLLMSNCKEITQLPANMCCLINLHHLEISGTPLKEMPPQMCKLSNLQTLSDFVLGENGGYRIKELGDLQSLHGCLCIHGLENVVDIGDALQADLKNKECLTELILIWKYGKTDDSTKEREVLAALEPHKKLKKLTIDGYRGTTFPGWIAHESFSDMVEVELTRCLNCCLLPPMGQLPSLRILRILCMDGLESIGDEFCGTSLTKSFPSLKELQIWSLSSLCTWSITGAEQEGEIFAHLKSIPVSSCDKLKVGLPAGCFPSLETINFSDCKEMVSVLPTSQVEVDAKQDGEIFPHLKSIRVLSCDKLKVGLPAGCFPSLETIDFYNCKEMVRVLPTSQVEVDAKQDGEIFPHLKSIRVLSCDKLKVGLPAGCFPSLETIDFSDCKEMVSVLPTSQVEVDAKQDGEIFPHLKSICVRSCDKLKVGLPAGCFPSLETIDFYDCKEMVSVLPTNQLEVDSAYPSLESIRCPRLEPFSGMEFPSNLRKLAIQVCQNLTANCLQRLSSLRSLNLGNYKFEGAVDSFPEEGLLPSTLTSLSIENFKNLTALNAKSFQHLTSLQELRISGCGELQCLPEGLSLSLTHLKISGCGELQCLQCLPEGLSLSLTHLEISDCGELQCLPEGLPLSLTHLEISDCGGLQCLPEGLPLSLTHLEILRCGGLRCLPEGLPLSLTHLTINYCGLLGERCQRGTGEDWPKIQHIPNIRINYREI